MADSKVEVLVMGLSASLLLAFLGLVIGAELAILLPPPSPTVFLVPLALNAGLGWTLIKKCSRPLGLVLLCGGGVASLALPFVFF